jgi:hypothetical protein
MFIYDTSPCKECNARTWNCHSKCKSYQEWLVEHNEKKEKAEKLENSYKKFYKAGN